VGCKLACNVKLFESKMGKIAKAVRVWSRFFDDIQSQSMGRKQSLTKGLRATGAKQTEGCSEESDETKLSQSSSMGNPPTPQMPRFSKSFARTPMGQKLNMSTGSDGSIESHESSEQGSFSNQMSPATARMVEYYNTPRQKGLLEEGELNTSNILDISDITPATPNTPEDGNYGPSSDVKVCQMLMFGTPTRHATGMLLSSGTRSSTQSVKNTDVSRNSSNIETPTLDSPFRANPGSAFGGSQESGDKENMLSPNVSIEPRSILKTTNKRSCTAPPVSTPISTSLAKKKRRMSYASTTSSHEDGLETEEEILVPGGANEELLQQLSDEYDEPAPEFDLKLFPKLFQSGEGADQVTLVYSTFSETKAFSLNELQKAIPDFGQSRLELMLDMLVSRRLLRPFYLDNNLYWRLPTS